MKCFWSAAPPPELVLAEHFWHCKASRLGDRRPLLSVAFRTGQRCLQDCSNKLFPSLVIFQGRKAEEEVVLLRALNNSIVAVRCSSFCVRDLLGTAALDSV